MAPDNLMSEDRSSSDERRRYGGQAVVEGVMMRSPNYFAIACRRLSKNDIVTHVEPVPKGIAALNWLNKPFLRGTFALIDTMALGIKSLTYAANIQIDDEGAQKEAASASAVDFAMGQGSPVAQPAAKTGPSQSVTNIAIGATTVLSMVIGIALFWTLPASLTDFILPHIGLQGANATAAHGDAARTALAAKGPHGYWGQLAASLVEGVIRLIIFFAYLLAISRMTNVQRVFEYHGAEHKAINTLEANLPLTVENARGVSRIHPRCGTNFIFIVLTTSILVFSVIPRHNLSEGIGLALSTHIYRLLLLPIVAGIAYELLKFAGANRDKKWALALVAPGLWTQLITTREPDDSQIEVALASLQSVWDKEHQVEPPSAAGTDPVAAAVA